MNMNCTKNMTSLENHAIANYVHIQPNSQLVNKCRLGKVVLIYLLFFFCVHSLLRDVLFPLLLSVCVKASFSLLILLDIAFYFQEGSSIIRLMVIGFCEWSRQSFNYMFFVVRFDGGFLSSWFVRGLRSFYHLFLMAIFLFRV